MNSIFNIKRFCLLLRKELTEKSFSIMMIPVYAIVAYLFIWAMTLLYDSSLSADTRSSIIFCLFSIVVFLTPYIVYRNENRRLAGTFYAIMPASALEKLLSVILISTFLIPAISFVVLHSLDSLLTLMPFNRIGFHGNVWAMIPRSFIPEATGIPSMDSHIINPSAWATILSGSSVAVFLCFLFRRHKIGYTILLNCGIGILTFILITLLFIAIEKNTIACGDTFTSYAGYSYVLIINAFTITLTYVFPVIFYILTYFRIKRIQY